MNVLKTLSLVVLAGLSGLGYATAQEPQRVIAHPGVNNARPADARSLKWKVAVGALLQRDAVWQGHLLRARQ